MFSVIAQGIKSIVFNATPIYLAGEEMGIGCFLLPHEKYMGKEEAQCWEKKMKMWIEGKREIDQLVILEHMI